MCARSCQRLERFEPCPTPDFFRRRPEVFDGRRAGQHLRPVAGPTRRRARDFVRYGLQLIGDHARLNQRLLTLGRAKGVALPVTLSNEDKSKVETMQRRTGRALDRALLAEFVRINAQDVTNRRKELATTRDAATRRAVTEFVRTEQNHLSEARQLQRG